MATINRHQRTGFLGVTAIAASLGPVAVTAAPRTTDLADPADRSRRATRIDEDTLIRGGVTDNVTASLRIAYEGMDELVIDSPDLSHVAVARITVQPGAQFPWHTHPGPVLVTVTQGELVYVMADGCMEHTYAAGSAFVDPGRGNVHTRSNPTDVETVIVATFTEMTADGPLTHHRRSHGAGRQLRTPEQTARTARSLANDGGAVRR